jgi:uncharacterized damage-inducible protein DinB
VSIANHLVAVLRDALANLRRCLIDRRMAAQGGHPGLPIRNLPYEHCAIMASRFIGSSSMKISSKLWPIGDQYSATIRSLRDSIRERPFAGLKERLMTVTQNELSVQVAINSWRLVLERANKAFASLTDEHLLKEIAPGKNRLIYLLGHLTAVHDAMFPILGLGERLHPELDAIFISSPDKAGAQPPPAAILRTYWDEVNGKLLSQFATLSEKEWLQRHRSMSEEDYVKDPTRNRLAVLLSRTNHLSYHLGQITLALK